MATVDNERYLRHILLLGEGGLLVLRRIVQREANKGKQPLEHILSCNRQKFDNLFPEQRVLLFPSSTTVNANVETWDTSLLMTVINRLFRSSLTSPERASICVLQSYRNEIQGHPNEIGLSAADYIANRSDVTTALRLLAKAVDNRTIDEVEKIINKANSDIDILSTFRHVKELHEFKGCVLDAIDRRFEVTNSHVSTVVSKANKLEDSMARLLRLQVITRKEKTEKALKTIIRAACDENEKERKAIKLLYDFVTLLQKKNDLTEEEIKHNIQKRIEWHGELSIKLLDDLMDWFTDMKDIQGTTTGPAEHGSIQIPIYCSSLAGVLDHVEYMYGYNCQNRLSVISYTVSKIFDVSCVFSWTVSPEDLEATIAIMAEKMEAESTSSESTEIMLPLYSSSRTAITRILKMFGKGRTNHHLAKLSDTLSLIFQAPIHLTTSIDLHQCLKAFYKNEKEEVLVNGETIEVEQSDSVFVSIAQDGTASQLKSFYEVQSVSGKQDMEQEVVHYIASIKGWPGIARSQQSIRDIVDRCSHVENMFGMSKHSIDMYEDVSEVEIYVSSCVKLDPCCLLVRPECLEKKETLFLKVSERNSNNESFSLPQKCSSVFIDNRGVKIVEGISSNHIQLVTEIEEETSANPDSPSKDLEQIKKELSSLVERIVFEILTVKFNLLKSLHDTLLNERSSDSSRSVSEAEDQIKENSEGNVSHLMDTIKDILSESKGLFTLSSIPEDKHPTGIIIEEKQITKEFEEELFRLDETIRGCGYSYGTFNINIESLPDEEKNLNRKKRIKDFLNRYDINDVKFNIVSKEVSEYKYVGAEVSTDMPNYPGVASATLGGFASFTIGNKTSICGLLSRHVADSGTGKIYLNEHGRKTELGQVIKETLISEHPGLDIAAMELRPEFESKCDVRFKNSENIPLPGRLVTPEDEIWLQGLPVHLWGARSKPGNGIITIPKLKLSGFGVPFLQLEDRIAKDGIERLAIPGDSGAIVCANDPEDKYVYVISMLMGTIFNGESGDRRRYISFYLWQGVEELQNRTEGKFRLRGIDRTCLKAQ